MCGIAGIYYQNKKVQYSDLKIMADKLAHRGPDGEGIWINEDDNIGFAHRRLSIIDLSNNASQPMHYADERFTITYNGEIYNYLELKSTLLEKGYNFKSKSDTEVILALFQDMGVKCLELFDGMFALAVWDNEEKQLFLARDRFGEKPLYYCFIDGGFCFASEMKSLFAIGASKETSPERVYKYLQANVLIDGEDLESTFYTQVKQIDAANFAIVKDGKIKQKEKYWTLDNISFNVHINIEEAAEEFRNLLYTSIKRRMRSDVPVGSSLSGGIDSSAIVLIANQLKRPEQVQNTFSARFKNFSKDEGQFIEMVTGSLKDINQHNVWPEVDQLLEELNSLAYCQEEPFSSGSIYNQHCVMRLAKEYNTTVLLDGQGADEQLGGYLHYYFHHLTHLITNNPKQFIKERRAYQVVHKETMPYRIPRKLPLWYAKKFLFKSEYKFDTNVRSLLKTDTESTGLKELLRYGDRNSMAFSREVRLPFLSHELCEFIFSLPIDYILRDGWTKFILRKAMDGIVPEQIVWRKDKVGFEPPQENWVSRLKPMIKEYKERINYLDFTNGCKVENITDWKYLMLKLFINDGI